MYTFRVIPVFVTATETKPALNGHKTCQTIEEELKILHRTGEKQTDESILLKGTVHRFDMGGGRR